MISLADKPLLQYQATWPREEAVTDIVLLCGYRSEAIRDHFGHGQKWGVRIRYSLEEQPLGDGRRPAAGVWPGASDGALRYRPERGQHDQSEAGAPDPLPPPKSGGGYRDAGAAEEPYGIVRQERSGRICAFEEKPLLPHWMNAGVYVLSPEFFRRLPERGDHETTAFPELAAEGRLYGYHSRAYWRTIDTYKDLTEAEKEVRELALV